MVIVIGSGAGGATVTRELALQGSRVTLVERGPRPPDRRASRYYANVNAGVKILRTLCLGGSTLVSGGNALRCLEEELRSRGIDISREFSRAERDLGVRVLPDSFYGPATRRLMEAADALGSPMAKMPKFIDPARCLQDGQCAFGCPTDARWSALRFVHEAEGRGARVCTDTPADEILVSGGRVRGVRSGSRILRDDQVVLAAGALETPRLLQGIGLPTAPLFVDTFVTIGGFCSGAGFNTEIPMNAYLIHDRSLVTPHFSRQLADLLTSRGWPAAPSDVLGMMVKIRDDDAGRVDDSVWKAVTPHDAGLLSSGAAHAGAILAEAGADIRSLVAARLRGTHPGGTARIGVSVDTDLQTPVDGLYVADASVLPEAPGGPPILTIVALGKYAARRILGST